MRAVFPPVQLPSPPGAGGVPRPAGEAGGVVALDWAGFKGAVSYTFDDANSTQIQHYDALQALGVRMTFYLQTNKLEASNSTWARALDDGHELGNHTHSHAMTDDGSDTDEATQFIETTFGVRPLTMAAPYGASGYKAVASTRFMINRGVNNGLIKPADGTDPFSLFCYIPPENATADLFDAQVDAAQNEGGWRVVLVHGFTGGSDGAFQPVALEEFVAAVEYAKSLGNLWIDSVLNIGAYWLGQKAFASVAPEVEPGGTIKHTWILPEHFPSGRVLRVTASGGTLTQAGRELPWNDLGYYEVSLDERSLTVAP
ncbi:MAG TPA: polysaccharide deacetylase family protein [Polyangiaceae bacterium]|nr:polysaccharide deacetylase family protein [Polyangiaceae bacterium]